MPFGRIGKLAGGIFGGSKGGGIGGRVKQILAQGRAAQAAQRRQQARRPQRPAFRTFDPRIRRRDAAPGQRVITSAGREFRQRNPGARLPRLAPGGRFTTARQLPFPEIGRRRFAGGRR